MSKYYSTRTECIDREIVEPIAASGIAKANEYDIDAIADKLVVMEPMDERHECSYRVDAYMCDTVDILQAKLHDMTADRDKWKRTYKDVPPDVVDGWREVER